MKNTYVRKNRRPLMPALASLAVTMILAWAVAAQAQAVKGKGTPNFIPVWTSPSTIGDSLMQQSGTNVNVSGGIVATTLSGNGAGVTNVNAATLGGLPAGAFAQLEGHRAIVWRVAYPLAEEAVMRRAFLPRRDHQRIEDERETCRQASRKGASKNGRVQIVVLRGRGKLDRSALGRVRVHRIEMLEISRIFRRPDQGKRVMLLLIG